MEYEMSDVWTREDYVAMRCDAEDVGRSRVVLPAPEPEQVEAPPDVVLDAVVDISPQSMQTVAISTAMYLAQQKEDKAVALKAAQLLWDRAAGPIPLPARPEPVPQLPQAQELPPVPPWVDQGNRLAYQQSDYEGGHALLEAPDPGPPPTQVVPTQPRAAQVPATAPAAPPRLHVVQPKFFSSPTRPASSDLSLRNAPDAEDEMTRH